MNMNKSMKFIAVVGMVVALGAIADSTFANCNDGATAVYPVRQCG